MIFISHASADASMAMEICRLLEQNGIRCFIAPRDIPSGKEYAEEIITGIEESAAMVLLMSEAANRSPHVLREVERAVSKNIPLLVYKLENVNLSKSLEYFLMAHQWINKESRGDYAEILAAAEELEKRDRERAPKKAPEKESEEVPEKASEKKSAQAPEKVSEKESAQALGKNGETAAEKPRPRVWVYALCMALALLFVFYRIKITENSGQENPGTDTTEESTVKYDVNAGDTIIFGSYNDEPIQWRVLRIEDRDGRQTAVLISKYILTLKAFDAAESGKYNHDENRDYIGRDSEADTDMELQAYVRGNSSWQKSNIRTWLNADSELVAYEGQAPSASAMSEHQNGYQNEPGFLYHFTEEERRMLVERECHTPGNALEEGDIVTLDKVFLLSTEELDWFDEAGISKLTTPTEAALKQDTSRWYDVALSAYGVKEYCWWLRTPVEGFSSRVYLVENGYGIENDEISNNLRKANVGLEGFGVRPAVTIDLERYFALQ